MEQLKKGIILGLGLSKLNKKEVNDFVSNLYRKGFLSRMEAEELARNILEKNKKQNTMIENKIQQFVKDIVKREELATLEHIDYLEKRIELLEEELDKLILEKEINDMNDAELDKLLKELDENEEVKEPKKTKKTKKTKKEPVIEEIIIEEDDEDLDKLLRELGIDPRELEKELEPEIDVDEDELLDDLLDISEDELNALLEEKTPGRKINIKSKKTKAKTTKKKSTKTTTSKKNTKKTTTKKKSTKTTKKTSKKSTNKSKTTKKTTKTRKK